MKWIPRDCRYGDIVRVRIGSIYHFGIFVSESEVIQFGMPPMGIKRTDNEDIRVLSTSAEQFACGQIVEVGVCERGEKKFRRLPDDTVIYAREKLGTDGYDLLHNNCEHFANECAFGRRFSEQEEDARRKWRERNVLDVYLMSMPAESTEQTLSVFPEARQAQIDDAKNTNVKRERYYVWKLLEYGLKRSFSLSLNEAELKCSHGYWHSPHCYFSLSHSGNIVAVAVSNRPVGVDIELIAPFAQKTESTFISPQKFAEKICAKEELASLPDFAPETLTKVWTQKESQFKKTGARSFWPRKVIIKKESAQTVFGELDGNGYCLSVSADTPVEARLHTVNADQ